MWIQLAGYEGRMQWLRYLEAAERIVAAQVGVE